MYKYINKKYVFLTILFIAVVIFLSNANILKTNNEPKIVEKEEKTMYVLINGKNYIVELEDNNNLFDRFWGEYPRKEAKPKARIAFEKIDPDETTLQAMLEAIQKWKDSAQWKEDGGKYIPHPATWLNQRRWEDEPMKGGSGNGNLGRGSESVDGPVRSQYDWLNERDGV